MIIYNTLSRKKEDFQTLEANTAKMYSCGPTVYGYAHIGNMRTYIFMDLVRRSLSYNGYKLLGVMNITDVGHLQSDGDDGEDKMEITAKKQNKSPYEIAEFYTKVFFEDLNKLNISRPEIIAKATDHIQEMIEYVEVLVEKGYGYEISDGIYFDISKFPDYGKLSRQKLDEQVAGARVEVNSEKRHPADFALWKKAEPNHIMQWQSPWGMGYPGWHIECSVMSMKYLGECFDIHTGGVDHIPVHHENEIAQNEAKTGKKTVNYWMHGEFMQVDGGKMSKSLGNVYTISQLEEMGYNALDFRYFCFLAHYRKKLNFTFEGMNSAKTALNRLRKELKAHYESTAVTPKSVIEGYKKEFDSSISDDINITRALGILWNMIKEPKSRDIFDAAMGFDSIFALNLNDFSLIIEEKEEAIPDDIIALAEKRYQAKLDKDWATADLLRKQLTEKGYSVMDRKDGYDIKKND